jgi:hypothetical protein
MADKTSIANMTFAHCGISQTVADIDAASETRVEIDQFNAFWPTVLRHVWSKWMPDFVQKIATLTLIQADPNDGWAYEYIYPSDCLIAKRISDGSRLGVDEFNEIPYQISSDGTDRVIWTDESAAALLYIHDFTNTGEIPDSVALALSYMMAGYIAPAVTENRNSGLNLRKMGEMEMSAAMADQYNERGQDPRPEAESIRGR